MKKREKATQPLLSREIQKEIHYPYRNQHQPGQRAIWQETHMAVAYKLLTVETQPSTI
jgi:hypothetical protein